MVLNCVKAKMLIGFQKLRKNENACDFEKVRRVKMLEMDKNAYK